MDSQLYSRYSSKIIDQQKHLLFYTVVQSLFYIIIFKQEEFRDDFLQGLFSSKLDINGIISSPFDPLKVILSSVRSEFINLCRKLKIGYSVINNKYTEEESSFEYFFPFEPCLLKNTAISIQDFYVFWEDQADLIEQQQVDDQVDEVCMMITSSVSL